MEQKRNLWTRFLVFLLGLLGISTGTSCEKIFSNVCLYGCPQADYKVIGDITDDDGKAIDNADVKVGPYYPGKPVDDAYCPGMDAVSDSLGHYDITFSYNGSLDTLYLVTSAKGYINDTSMVVFGDLVDGDGNWYLGKNMIEKDVTLKKEQ